MIKISKEWKNIIKEVSKKEPLIYVDFVEEI